MVIDLLKETILAHIGQLRPAPKQWLKRNCPVCHTKGHGKDLRARFGIQFNANTILLNCFNCGFGSVYVENEPLSRTFKTFLIEIGVNEQFIKKTDFEIFKQLNKIGAVRDGDADNSNLWFKFRNLSNRWPPIELPKDSLPIATWLEAGLEDDDFLEVANYAIGRKLYDLDKFYWSPCKKNNTNRRLIIPYRYKKDIVGYTGRLCYNANKHIPKYFNVCTSDFVYNVDNQENWTRKYVIVNEGVLDAYITDGVGILGEINKSKIDTINRLQKDVIVCPDNDSKGWDLVKVAIDNNWAVSFPKWDKNIKDAASAAEKYGRLLTVHSIIDSAVSNKASIELKWKIRAAEMGYK